MYMYIYIAIDRIYNMRAYETDLGLNGTAEKDTALLELRLTASFFLLTVVIYIYAYIV